MEKFHTLINENGRILIPAAIRKELNLQAGDDLIISLFDKNSIKLETAKSAINKLQKMTKDKKLSLSEELIKMRRKDLL